MMIGVYNVRTTALAFYMASILMFGQEGLCYDRNDFLVRGLDEIEPAFKEFNGTMYAGLLPINGSTTKEKHSGELSFWLFTPNEEKDSLTIWLNGGPGCSSFHGGLIMECSPVTTAHYPAGHGRTSSIQPLVPNKYSWTEATNLLFLEQPAGVGFSHGPIVESEEDLSRDFYNFLLNFFDTFQEMRKKSLFIVGESYAGYYVPSIAHYIHEKNKLGKKHKMNLAGIGLGNGWIDAMIQGPTVIEYAYWHGMIDSTTKETLKEVWKHCANKEHLEAPFHDFTVPDECNIMGNVMDAAGASVFPSTEHYAPNPYDVTTWDNYPQITNPQGTSYHFFNNPEVRKALNFGNVVREWHGCIPGAGRRHRRRRLKLKGEEHLDGNTFLANDKPGAVTSYIVDLLDDAGIRVLVYAGDRDLTTNLQGSEMVLDKMKWSGSRGWQDAKRYLWMVDESVAGYVKSHRNLDMLLVVNSGHLVPYNVPIPALDLITRLTRNESFNDILLPKISLPTSAVQQQEFKDLSEDVHQSFEISHTAFHAFLLISVALVCFSCGALAGARWTQSKAPLSYEPIPELSNGNHFLIESSFDSANQIYKD